MPTSDSRDLGRPTNLNRRAVGPVVIGGGGMAGLATAFELTRAKVPFVLLESSGRAGGVIVSERLDDFVLDGGPDSLLIQKPEGLALCRELGIADRLMPTSKPRLAFIQRGGQLYPLPAASVLGIPTKLWPFLRSGLFSWQAKLRMGAEWFLPPKTDGADESIGHFMTRRFGQEATTYLAEPLLAGIHAGDVHRLSVGALFPRFTEAEAEYGSLLRAFRRPAKAPPIPDGPFRSLPGGMSELVNALTLALPKDSVRLNTRISRLTAQSSGFAVETASGERIAASAVVLATPAFATAAIVEELDPALARMAAQINYHSAGTVLMAFKRSSVAHPLRGAGFVVPAVERSGITAGSWLSSKWAGRAPEGFVLLRAFVGGARDPHAIERSDAELVRVALAALRPLLGISGEPRFTRVYRFPRANAQHDVGHGALVADIDRALTRHPGLFVTGSGFRGVGIPDVVADARDTARQVAQWLDASTA